MEKNPIFYGTIEMLNDSHDLRLEVNLFSDSSGIKQISIVVSGPKDFSGK